MTEFNTDRSVPVRSFPRSKAELLAQRINKKLYTLIDQVESLILDHADDEALARYFEPYSDANAVTGKRSDDMVMAAARVQEIAEAAGITAIVDVKQCEVKHAIIVALRRLNQSDRQRVEEASHASAAE